MPERLNWETDGIDWPNREASRFVDTFGIHWHVQDAGAGPTLVLVHGTGATTHTWHELLPLLTPYFRVIAMDLPGHGFTRMVPQRRLTIGRMARSVRDLLKELDVVPDIVVGHSAGAPVLGRMIMDDHIAPHVLVSLNGSFKPFEGMARSIFPALARMLFVNPVTPRLFAYAARDRERIDALIDGTGSKIGARGKDFYHRLFMSPAHVNGALSLMANWDLDPLYAALPGSKVPFVLVAAENDLTIPASDAKRLKSRMKTARVVPVKALGHLAHEEDPEQFRDIILDAWAKHAPDEFKETEEAGKVA